MNKLGIASAIALFLTGTASAQYRPSDPLAGDVPTYVVGGIALGSRVKFDSLMSREYKCGPSKQFEGLTWCQKMLRSSERRRPYGAYWESRTARLPDIMVPARYDCPRVCADDLAPLN